MKKQLIFNADDFGLSKGVNLGIIEAHQNGPVKSATLMASGMAFEHAVALAKEYPGLHIGVHLTLTALSSVGGIYKTLTNDAGVFSSLPILTERAKAQEVDLAEVEVEYERQIQKILAVGIVPTHFDSHHHTHFLPGIFDVFMKTAEKYGITRVRMPHPNFLEDKTKTIRTTDHFADGFYGEGVTIKNLKQIITHSPKTSLEIMLHPAYVDTTLYKASSYHLPRMLELDVLTSEELRLFLVSGDYQIASFLDLAI